MVTMMAPGGTKEMAMSVLDEGADSTYVGVMGWSRRGNRDELTDDEIRETIDYALVRDKEVRIVVNTLPSSTEIGMFVDCVARYSEWGAKGFMISDVGCMKLIREQLPHVDIHTSVGCGITNYEDVKFLQEMGASYVVLPYRMSIEEISEISREGKVGIEVFLFKTPSGGKICPGKCMMSSYFSFKRFLDKSGKDHFFGSASRGGDCLRVCQTNWNFNVEEMEYQDKLKIKTNPSLWVTDLLDYINAGVTCLKVPGRDRSTRLVTDLVRLYRRVLDEIQFCDNPNLHKFTPEIEIMRERWKVERGRRDNRLIASAGSVSVSDPAPALMEAVKRGKTKGVSNV